MNDGQRPVRRAYQVYLYAACLATVLVALFATWQAVYAVVRVAAPGTTVKADPFGSAGNLSSFFGSITQGDDVSDEAKQAIEDTERDRGVAQLIENGLLAVLAGGLFAFHWGRARDLRDDEPAVVPPAPTARPDSPAAPARTSPTRRPSGPRAPRTRPPEE